MKKTALTQSSIQSTIHGVGYIYANIFDQKLNIVDCLLGLVLVIAFDSVAAAGGAWCHDQWGSGPVVTLLQYDGKSFILLQLRNTIHAVP